MNRGKSGRRRRAAAESDQDGFLPLRIRSAVSDLVVGELDLTTRHLDRHGLPSGIVVMGMASQLASHGAALALPPHSASRTIESKLSFLASRATRQLTGEARLLYRHETVAVWRTVIFDENLEALAELTQTEQALGDYRISGDSAVEKADSARGVPDGEIRAINDRPARGNVAAERREQIFRGACEVFAQKGYANATVRDIAAAAGMPVPTMYLYVRRKEDILSMIYTTFLEDIGKQVDKSLRRGGSASEKLELAIRANLKSLEKYRKYIVLMFQETRSLPPGARRKVFEIDRDHLALWQRVLGEGKRANEFEVEHVELVANLIAFLCVVWPLRHWAIGKYGVDAVTKALTSLIFSGIRNNDR